MSLHCDFTGTNHSCLREIKLIYEIRQYRTSIYTSLYTSIFVIYLSCLISQNTSSWEWWLQIQGRVVRKREFIMNYSRSCSCSGKVSFYFCHSSTVYENRKPYSFVFADNTSLVLPSSSQWGKTVAKTSLSFWSSLCLSELGLESKSIDFKIRNSSSQTSKEIARSTLTWVGYIEFPPQWFIQHHVYTNVKMQ